MIGVCIKYFHENYGGMLQAFATIKMLESREMEYELIRYKKNLTLRKKIKSIPRLLNTVLLKDKYEAFLKKKGMMKHPEFAENNAIRMKAFDEFKKNKFIKLSTEYVGYKELCKGAKKYSAVISGSDQLWSPAGLPTNFYNLMFVPDEVRKISYASSFGVSQIPWYQTKRTANYLKRLDYISMRENRGSQIVKELIGKEVPVILDPVFNFDKEQWKELIPVKNEISEEYIFAYFLGNTVEYRKKVEAAANKLGYKIVVLRHLDQYIPEDETFGDIALYDVGPERFINLFRGAAYVCTDSFHGSCFSIINNKKFIVFNRYAAGSKNSKNSRIDTLCNNLGLQERRYNSNKTLEEQLNENIDYELVTDKIRKLKQDTDKYLDEAFADIK